MQKLAIGKYSFHFVMIYFCSDLFWPGGRFTKDISHGIQIGRKFNFALT